MGLRLATRVFQVRGVRRSSDVTLNLKDHLARTPMTLTRTLQTLQASLDEHHLAATGPTRRGTLHRGLILSGCAFLLGACGPEPVTAQTPEPMVQRTVVTLLPDGTSRSRTEEISATQQRLEIAERADRQAGRVAPPHGGVAETQQGLASLDSCAAYLTPKFLALGVKG